MKKKNILAMVLALALVAVLAVGATLAYFTDNDTTTNTFTMGKVNINLDESKDGKEWKEDGLDYTNIVPGDTETKIARVTVSGDSEDCYLMVTAKITTPDSTKLTSTDIGLLYTALDNAIKAYGTDNGGIKWEVSEKTVDGEKFLQCVYKGDGDHIAHKGDELILFEEIQIPGPEFKNNTAGQSFGIELKAYAIQSDNVNNGVYADTIWNDIDNFEEVTDPVTAPAA